MSKPSGLPGRFGATYGHMKGLHMSKVVRGFVVSKNAVNGMWRAWDASGEMGSFCADSYRGLLAMIRERRA